MVCASATAHCGGVEAEILKLCREYWGYLTACISTQIIMYVVFLVLIYVFNIWPWLVGLIVPLIGLNLRFVLLKLQKNYGGVL